MNNDKYLFTKRLKVGKLQTIPWWSYQQCESWACRGRDCIAVSVSCPGHRSGLTNCTQHTPQENPEESDTALLTLTLKGI